MMSAPRAVLFDLFNTLVPGGSRAERDEVSRLMAEALEVEPEALANLVRGSFDDRTRGRLGDLGDTVRSLAQQLGANPSDAALSAAVELRLELTRSLHERTWAVPVLRELGAAGILRGLVSDCSAETPAIWSTSPLAPHFEALSFSCVTGRRKPEPEAYLIAVDALGITARECLYVGDGDSFELTGAEALGMLTVRVQRHASISQGDVIEDDLTWSGDVITHLSELMTMLD